MFTIKRTTYKGKHCYKVIRNSNGSFTRMANMATVRAALEAWSE